MSGEHSRKDTFSAEGSVKPPPPPPRKKTFVQFVPDEEPQIGRQSETVKTGSGQEKVIVTTTSEIE